MDRIHFTNSLVYENHLTFSSNKNPFLLVFKTSLPLHYLGTRCDLMDDSGSIVDSSVDQEIEFRFNLMLDSLEDWKVTINKKEHERYSLSGELSWNVRSSHRRCSLKKLFWKISQYSQENFEFFLWRHLQMTASGRYSIASGCKRTRKIFPIKRYYTGSYNIKSFQLIIFYWINFIIKSVFENISPPFCMHRLKFLMVRWWMQIMYEIFHKSVNSHAVVLSLNN